MGFLLLLGWSFFPIFAKLNQTHEVFGSNDNWYEVLNDILFDYLQRKRQQDWAKGGRGREEEEERKVGERGGRKGEGGERSGGEGRIGGRGRREKWGRGEDRKA